MHKVYSDEEKYRATQADIVSILERCGERVRVVGSEYEWLCNGQSVSIKDNLWFHHYEQIGGNTVSFVKKFFGMDYPQALALILGEEAGQVYTKPIGSTATMKPEKVKRDFELPTRNRTMNLVFRYLVKDRGIDRDVVDAFAHKGLIYESAGKHNAVFVGTDKNGTPKHAHLRSTIPDSKWRINQRDSDNRFTFNWRGTNQKVYLFEAPIDLMSYICMHKDNWQENSYIAACSVSEKSLMQMLEDNPDLTEVYICLDNDKAGQEATARIKNHLSENGYDAQILIPNEKDWNEDLLAMKQEEGETECPVVSQSLSLS